MRVLSRLDIFWCAVLCSVVAAGTVHADEIWKIGEADNSINDLALKRGEQGSFLARDFGWEDRVFVIGHSKDDIDWPHIFPGPKDRWGGTSRTAGIRNHVLNILFGLDQAPVSDEWKLVIDFYDISKSLSPLAKITVNGTSWKFPLPRGSGGLIQERSKKKGRSNASREAEPKVREYVLAIPLPAGLIRRGGNEIGFGTLDGSWCAFDQVRLEGPVGAKLSPLRRAFLRGVRAADHEIMVENRRAQPLLVDVEHLDGTPTLAVQLDGEKIFSGQLEQGRYIFEAPMPALEKKRESRYEILLEGRMIDSGTVVRAAQPLITPADYVDTLMGSAHSRWMIAPGPWMPFSMVKLSPDNQDTGWQGGYQPTIESIRCFSHIHEWTMGGLGMMPCTGSLQPKSGGGASRIDKNTERAGLGAYSVHLVDHNIDAAVTATTRCGFHRYTFREAGMGRVMIDLMPSAEYPILSRGLEIEKVSDTKLAGFNKQYSKAWGSATQDYILHFVVEFDRPIKTYGTWAGGKVESHKKLAWPGGKGSTGAFVEFDLQAGDAVQARVGISLVSIENAQRNLDEEIVNPFGWSFDGIVANQRDAWNDLLGRIAITTDNRREKRRFYTNLYRSLCRNIWSDVDGRWVDPMENIRQLDRPDSVALGCDAFWNTFWNLNQLWNLVAPEWSSRWVRSQLAMYDAGGWLAKGPAGMEYIPVMVAEHEIPLVVGVYQMGIRDFDAEKAFEAVLKMQTTPGTSVGGGFAGNRDLETYLKHKYVPSDKGRFSNSLEYSFDDWTVAQFAKALGKTREYERFMERGAYWKNAIDPETGYARLRRSDGTWEAKFDPFKSGANKQYVEGNAWQLTFFVPQDVPALVDRIGRDRFLERLEWGFGESERMRYNAPNDAYWDYPVVQGNQQSMHFAYLFNWVGRPWLTQRWTRSIMDRYYGHGVANAYLGDEDQGQMSAWFVMSAIGLFQTDGGCRAEPIYELGSPLYPKVAIDLGSRYGRGKTFVIEAREVSHRNKYIQRALLNGEPLGRCRFPARELLKGGSLLLDMGPEPNASWGNGSLPKSGE